MEHTGSVWSIHSSLFHVKEFVSCKFFLNGIFFRSNYIIKDIHREKEPSIKKQALTKSMNMDIWVVCTSNQLFIRGS